MNRTYHASTSTVTRLLGGLITATLLLSTAGAAETAQEWTRFRGPNGTGISTAKTIPVSFDESDYHWNVELPGSGHSSPVLWDDKIFLTCKAEDEDQRSIVCLDAADGKVLWSHTESYVPYRSHSLNSFAASTPALDADRLYVSWVSDNKLTLLALDHQGDEVWRRTTGDFASMFGAGASPIVLDGSVIVGHDHSGTTAFLLALDAKTGETRWKLPRTNGYASYITPTVHAPEGRAKEVLFIGPEHGITAVDPATGKVNWEVDADFTLKTTASPVIAGGLVFASAGKGGGGQESAVVRPGSASSKAELVYRIEDDLPYVPTPIAFGDHIFILSDSGTMTCREPASGDAVWSEQLEGTYFSSPICVDGKLYCVSRQGDLVVLAASPEFKLLAENRLPEGSHATPAVAGGRMYIRTYNRLICIGAAR
ncbi:MAG: PQQ-binding-like beta-propeller repeat protein [Thermoguttaceae bacterium]